MFNANFAWTPTLHVEGSGPEVGHRQSAASIHSIALQLNQHQSHPAYARNVLPLPQVLVLIDNFLWNFEPISGLSRPSLLKLTKLSFTFALLSHDLIFPAMLLPKGGMSFLYRSKRTGLTKDPLCLSLARRHQASLDEFLVAFDGHWQWPMSWVSTIQIYKNQTGQKKIHYLHTEYARLRSYIVATLERSYSEIASSRFGCEEMGDRAYRASAVCQRSS